jgi:hypothetical protein
MHFVGGFVASPKLAADRIQNRPCVHRPVQNHQAQFALIEVQMAATPLDYLVTALVSCDLQSVLLCERLDFRHGSFRLVCPNCACALPFERFWHVWPNVE